MLNAAAALLAVTLGIPQQPDSVARPATRQATAVRATDAPQIDGRDDDIVWRSAPRFSEFRQFEPKIDADPSFRTEFRAAFDERNLYVFVRMFDPHPDSIMRALTRRDVRGPSDQIKLMIDSYDDKRSGFEFAVNPDGVKRDFSMSNDTNEDGSWNGVWDVSTRIDSLGWTAEYRIPLSQLRYAKSEAHTFGFGVWRDIERYKERTSWPVYLPTKNGMVSQLGRLSGMTSISSERRVEMTPYVVTKNVQRLRATNAYVRDQQVTAGGDLKIGVTPNITLDATVNPDFGQVEADPANVNLSAFEQFFSERRPFFVEGTNLYRFSLNCYIVVDCSTNEGLFYSRRIGRSPALRNLYGDATTATATPIAAASKLTGRLSNGLSFGLLDAVTERVNGIDRQTVEPTTNFSVLRAQQDLRGGEAGISVIATAVNRSLDKFTEAYMHRSAYTTGATMRNRFANGRYELAAQFAGSYVSGTPQTIATTQRNSVHYFQQPGDDLTYDSTRTSLAGHSEQVKFGKYGGGITRFESSIVRQSAGFEVNDIGFLRRADILDWSTWAALSFRNARGIYRWAQVNGNHWETWNTSGTRLENALNFNGHMGLQNNWDVHLGGTVGKLTPSFCDRCTRGGPLVRQSRSFSPWGGFNSDSRRVVSGGWWTNLWFSDEGKSHGWNVGPYVSLRPSPSTSVNIGTNFTRDHNNSQWLGNFVDASNATHYTFAHLYQRTVSMNTRINYTMTPDLTLEFYGEPYVTQGAYSDVREVSSTPAAESYDARFASYTPPSNTAMTFKFSQFRSNAVMRWEYRPGSTLFFVWQQNRSDTDPLGDFSFSRDRGALFDAHPDNIFLVKATYWIAF